ncbi:GNAT family N-acetyltransferase [Fulvivirga sp. 29W222]|uniref:GNAT family N-acetyltransferase n=1 Tax=Fulvivirga marina TaxID=2494733 RepID=A0A937FZD2_9BACT|nr:GNAT family N-acetyltransferase [Fulvivirga marina]MBL6447763.1 GNAT family N-acetyltransferase [Fulvivirga marina]
MILRRTDSDNVDFVTLVKLLDADLKVRDGEDHAFYDQFNKIDNIKNVVVAYENDVPVGCGAIKPYGDDGVEVKRMFVAPKMRGRGIAVQVLAELEQWAKELGCMRCVLETGKKQPEAIGLYKKNGYQVTPNYGQYAGVENSICFEKKIV